MLDVRKRGLETWMVFRLLLPEGGLEHVSFLLSARETARPGSDISSQPARGPMSEMIRRHFSDADAGEPRPLERLTDGEALLMKHLDKVEAMMAARGRGLQAALKITARSQRLRGQGPHADRVEMAAGVDDATYQQAISDMQRLFPDDPANAMLARRELYARAVGWRLEAVDVAART